MHVYIFGSGMFALLRYIYIQAFGYCRFLEKLENTLPLAGSRLPSLNFYANASDRMTIRQKKKRKKRKTISLE